MGTVRTARPRIRRVRLVAVQGATFYGMLSDSPDKALPPNNADHWLHFGVGLVMVMLALTLTAGKVPTGAEGEILVPD